MLRPTDRELYSRCLEAPEGYRFDSGVATTFSLDMESLLFVPLALAFHGAEDPAAFAHDPVGLLDGIHQIADRLTVFAHDGAANVPNVPNLLYALLEPCLIPARARASGAIFHPKLWLLRFVGARDDVLLRALVLSRNLTTSRCWDTLVCLEGVPNARQRVKASEHLQRLVEALPDRVSVPELRPSGDRLAQIAQLADEAGRTQFEAPAPFRGEVTFYALGLGDGLHFPPYDLPDHRVLAISPFLGASALRKLAKDTSELTLISRAESLDRIDPKTLSLARCFTLNEAADASSEVAEGAHEQSTADSMPHGLHAKAYAVEHKGETWWLFGSGNLSDAVANGTNVELMVELRGSSSKVGIDVFLHSGFANLLLPYDPPAEPYEPDAHDDAERLADNAQEQLVRAPLRIACSEEPDSGTWKLDVLGRVPALGEGVRASIRPLSVDDTRVLDATTASDVVASFSGLSMESLTAFLAITVEAQCRGAKHVVRFTRKLPASGIPDERTARIVRSVIRDRRGFLAYLRRALAEIDGGVFASIPHGARKGIDGGFGASDQPVVLESLVRALRRDPARLWAIDRTVRELSEMEAADDAEGPLVPADFRELWETIRQVLPPREKTKGP